MKRILLAAALILTFCKFAQAELYEGNNVVKSSYTEAATAGPVMFATGTIQFVAIIVSSPAPNSYVVIHRSTSPFNTPGIATQTLVSTSYVNGNQPLAVVELFGITNTSYTFVNKVGTAKITYLFRLIGGAANVTPPGLKASGQQ